MNRLVNSSLCLIVFLFCCMASDPCIAQEAEPKINVRFVDSAGDLVSSVSGYWYRVGAGKAKKIVSADGKAEIPVNKVEGIIVAKSEGYQYSGLVLDSGTTTALSVVMLKDNEAGPAYENQPLPFSAEQKQQAIENIKEKLWEELEADPANHQVLQHSVAVLAKLTPDRTLEYFESNWPKGKLKVLAKQEIIRGLAESDFARAVELADSTKNPMYRDALLTALLKHGPQGKKMLAVEAELTNAIKNIPQPAYRLASWASLAEHYQVTDRPELAQQIVDQHIDEIKKLPAGGWSGFPRSLFAALIAETNPSEAVKLIEGMDKNEIDRAYGRVAFHCCRQHPQQAVELLQKIKPVERAVVGFRHHVKVVHRMAVEHPDKAFELAASIDEPNQRAWALGMMASRLHESQSDRAKEALLKAVDALAEPTKQTRPANISLSPATTLAGLLPMAKDIAPEKMNSMIWQSVYLAVPRSRWNSGGVSKSALRQTTAAQISRYDRVIASALAGDQAIEQANNFGRTIPNLIALQFKSLSDELVRLDEVDTRLGPRSRRAAAHLLTASEESFWRSVSNPEYLNWPTEKFEEF